MSSWIKGCLEARVAGMSVALLVLAVQLTAQSVIGTTAGVVSFATGKVYLDNQAIEVTTAQIRAVKPNAVLRTQAGRAEMMLGSCAVVRLGEESSLRMVDDSLVAPRVELLGGAAVVDIPGIRKGSGVHMRLDTAAVTMARKGLYRFDYSPAQLKVFNGQASVGWQNGNLVVTAGRMFEFGRATEMRFDKRDSDAFDLWSRVRGQLLAQARAAQHPAHGDAYSRAAAAQRAQTDAADGRTVDWNDPGGFSGKNGGGGGSKTMQNSSVNPRPVNGDTGCRF